MTLFCPATNQAAIQAGTLSLSGTFYALLLTVLPLPSIVTVSQLSVSSDPLALPVILQTSTTTVSGVTSFSVTESPVFQQITQADQFVAIAIARRAGASVASTDPVIYVSALREADGLTVAPAYQLTAAGLRVIFPTTPIINNNTTRFIFQHNSINTTSIVSDQNNGLLGKLGTNNGTQAYANPIDTKVNMILQFSTGGVAQNAATRLACRDKTNTGWALVTGSNAVLSCGMDFGVADRRINPTALLFELVSVSASPVNWEVFGSNSLSSWSLAAVSGTADWTSLGTLSTVSTVTQVYQINLTNLGYWRYLKFSRAGVGNAHAMTVREIEIAGRLSSLVNNLN